MMLVTVLDWQFSIRDALILHCRSQAEPGDRGAFLVAAEKAFGRPLDRVSSGRWCSWRTTRWPRACSRQTRTLGAETGLLQGSASRFAVALEAATEPRLDVHMEYTPLVLVALRDVVALLIGTLLQLPFCQGATPAWPSPIILQSGDVLPLPAETRTWNDALPLAPKPRGHFPNSFL